MIFPKPFVTIGNQIVYTHLTPDEQEDRERARSEARYMREIRKVQSKEVRYFSKAIPYWLALLGHAYWYKKSEKDLLKGHYRGIKFTKCQIGEDAYYFRINTKRLPRRVSIAKLRDEETLENLTASAEAAVKFHQTATGSWYAVDTQFGRGTIPVRVGYAEMIKMIPPDAPPLTTVLGMGENRRPYFSDLEKNVNFLVGGSKGTGKSNDLNGMLCTLLTRNSPYNLRVILTDLKGGIEFADYNGVPHLGGDVRYTQKTKTIQTEKGERTEKTVKTVPNDYRPKTGEDLQPPIGNKIYTEPYDVIPMLKYVEAELDRRSRLLAGKAKKISTYNKRFPDKALAYWLIVIDELATLMENKKYKTKATEAISEIARKGRAVGIFIIVATQTPTSAIIDQQIGNNLDSRKAYRTGSGAASGILLGTGEYDAVRIPAIEGRFIYKWGTTKVELQAPYIADSTIKRIISQLRAGKYVDARQAELAQKAEHLFKFAVEYLNGECHTQKLYEMLRADGFKKADVKTILEQHEAKGGQPEITVDDVIYCLTPPLQAKRIARWLVPADDYHNNRHPHPDFNYDFLPENRNPEFPRPVEQVSPDSENSNGRNGSTPDEQKEEIDILAVESEQTDRANGRQADDPKPTPEPEPVLQNEETTQAGEVPAWLDEFS